MDHGMERAKKKAYHGETLRNVLVMRPRDLTVRERSSRSTRAGTVPCTAFFYLSTLAMLTSLQFFFLLLLYIELDMVKGERAFYKLNLSFYF
jgi:hypothetical protein